MAAPSKEKPQAVDLTTLPIPHLTSVKKQLDDELEHLTTSFTKLRAAQVKFQECLRTIKEGVDPKVKGVVVGCVYAEQRGGGGAGKTTLVPLTTSLYVPGTMADTENVIVDVGTGFYVEKVRVPAQMLRALLMETQTARDAVQFYNGKIEELAANLKDLESIIQGKSNNLRVVEDVLRQKVLSSSDGGSSGGSAS
ncbi:MAG: subunit of tubulin prefoldin [Geoglossum umbratile]|nr:MAG: subunit of tubulin prefoldin [Geoglossum umbratile]